MQEEVEGEGQDHGQDSALRAPPTNFYCSLKENTIGLIVGQKERIFCGPDGKLLKDDPISVRILINGKFRTLGSSSLLIAGKIVDISTKKSWTSTSKRRPLFWVLE